MNLLVCFANPTDARGLVERLSISGGSDSIQFAPSLARARDTLRDVPIDMLLVDPPLMDQSLALRRAEALAKPPSYRLVLATSSLGPALLVRAAHFGFAGVIDHSRSATDVLAQLSDVASDRTSVYVHPMLTRLDIVPGLFARTLSFNDETERSIVDLLGLGLSDRDISTALQVPLQTVRNRVGRLIIENGLSTRTQLVALHIRGETSQPMP